MLNGFIDSQLAQIGEVEMAQLEETAIHEARRAQLHHYASAEALMEDVAGYLARDQQSPSMAPPSSLDSSYGSKTHPAGNESNSGSRSLGGALLNTDNAVEVKARTSRGKGLAFSGFDAGFDPQKITGVTFRIIDCKVR